MRALSARTRASRDALARCVWHLRAIAEASARVRAAPDVRRMVDAIADEAERAFAVARVAVEAFDRADAPVRAERGSERAGDPPAISAPLEEDRAGLQGSIALAGPARGRFDVIDRLLLAHYARLAGASLESARLVRDVSEAALRHEDVTAVVSHDFRGPLGTVALGAAMLRGAFVPRGEAARAEIAILDRVERGCKRMQRMLDDLQDVARADAGAFRVEPRPAEVAGLLRSAADEVGAHARSCGVEVRVVKGASLTLRVDRARALQAIGYLVDNALRATPRGGAVTLSAAPEGDLARVTVADAGPGLAPEVVAHAFDRYWQGPLGARGQRRIRLFLVRVIAEAHGGRAEARSELGRGSAFSLLLPRDLRAASSGAN